MAERKQCAALLDTERFVKRPCRRPAQIGSKWCWQHDPDPPSGDGERVTVYRVIYNSFHKTTELVACEGLLKARSIRFDTGSRATSYKTFLRLADLPMLGLAFCKEKAVELFTADERASAARKEREAAELREAADAAEKLLTKEKGQKAS